jgi:hypothetical protein
MSVREEEANRRYGNKNGAWNADNDCRHDQQWNDFVTISCVDGAVTVPANIGSFSRMQFPA